MKNSQLIALLLWGSLNACQSLDRQATLYEALGGAKGVEHIVDNFIVEIGYSPTISKHFEKTDLAHFREKQIEHICEVSDGPCQYSGDSMLQSHKNQHITEAEFNQTVDLLINAMNKAGIAQTAQNRLLARLAPMRSDIIYQ